MTQPIIEKNFSGGGGGGGGGGGETNVKLKRLGAIYTKQYNSVHVFCHLLSLHCQAKIWEGWGTPAPSLKLFWCVGKYTLLLVCTGVCLMVQSMSWVCMLMGVI